MALGPAAAARWPPAAGPGVVLTPANCVAASCLPPTARHASRPVKVTAMPKFMIEREVPGASALTPAELHAISRRSVGVLRQLGPEIQWVESYVAGNSLYCVYVAPDEEMIREHGRLGGFPVNKVSEVKTMIDPTTAE